MSHISAMLIGSLGSGSSDHNATMPGKQRMYVQNESIAWQDLSQKGADAEHHAMPALWARKYRQDGKTINVPKRGKRLPPPNRLLELHGLAGAIGEQLGLAWTAEQDVQRLIATRAQRGVEHQRLVQRAVAELSGHFILGAAHSLANLVLRLLLLNEQASRLLRAAYKVDFVPGADERKVWPTLNERLVKALYRAAADSANRFMNAAVDAISDLRVSKSFVSLDDRRGLDYHRRRPQSLEHVSPRRNLVVHGPATTVVTMPAAALEPEADADAVHFVVVEALETLRSTMRTIRTLIPKAVRAEGITYIFG